MVSDTFDQLRFILTVMISLDCGSKVSDVAEFFRPTRSFDIQFHLVAVNIQCVDAMLSHLLSGQKAITATDPPYMPVNGVDRVRWCNSLESVCICYFFHLL
jgi:hypothetical protein